MSNKLIYGTFFLILFCGFLSACGRPTPVSLAGEVETRVAATIQAGSESQVVTPMIIPTAMPAQVLPPGSFTFLADQCEQMRSAIEQSVGVPAMLETTPFTDRVGGGTGTACRIHVSGTGTTLSMAAFTTLDALVKEKGWSWDMEYGAAGPTGMQEGYRKGGAVGILGVTWKPSSRDLCPSDQPIEACVLTPEQKLFDVTFDIAQVVIYVPLSANDCSEWLTILQPSIPVLLVQETVNFIDLEGNAGTACQVHGAGTGLDFGNFVDTANVIGSVLTSQGWSAGNGADGPTGTVREYTIGNETAIVTLIWEPSPDANCPKDQPIGACILNAEQRLYTLTVAFAQK
jgi:hypothetical protein